MGDFRETKFTTLEFAYPPVSNQEALWLEDDPNFSKILESSDYYMIVGRAEAKFENLIQRGPTKFDFDFSIGGGSISAVEINLADLPSVVEAGCSDFDLEFGDKMLKVFDATIESKPQLIDWFTTEKLVWHRSRQDAGISGFDDFLNAATYDLLYVGIAKVGDTYTRLIKNGHKARTDILSNETQRSVGARVADEIYLLMFRVVPTVFRIYNTDANFEDGWTPTSDIDYKSVTADAEKALISILKPEYNRVQFKQYPKGADGVYGAGYERYGYVINENIVLSTPRGIIHGGRNPLTSLPSNSADLILIVGEDVELILGSP